MFTLITSWLTVTELMTLLMAGLGVVCNKSFRSMVLLCCLVILSGIVRGIRVAHIHHRTFLNFKDV